MRGSAAERLLVLLTPEALEQGDSTAAICQASDYGRKWTCPPKTFFEMAWKGKINNQVKREVSAPRSNLATQQLILRLQSNEIMW